MSHVIVTAAFAPIMREPNPRSEVVSQLLLGETGVITERQGDWYYVSRQADGYPGWCHRGYVREVSEDASLAWLSSAHYVVDEAILVSEHGRHFRPPLMARLSPSGAGWMLPSGVEVRLERGRIDERDEFIDRARKQTAVDWAISRFSGTSYLWGGVTPWGVDCSGMIQTTFAARGIVLPRDSAEQARVGDPVSVETMQPGDLLFFSDRGDRVTHVALAGDRETLVHSTLACGGFIVEPWTPGHRAAKLREQLVAVRRMADIAV